MPNKSNPSRNYARESLRRAIRRLDDAAYWRGFMDTPANIAEHHKARQAIRRVVAKLFIPTQPPNGRRRRGSR
jgi:hypothetical protein